MALVERCPVLVRRDEQLAALEDALLEARRGRGRLVVLSGEAGIGKTRLANELVEPGPAPRLRRAERGLQRSRARPSLPAVRRGDRQLPRGRGRRGAARPPRARRRRALAALPAVRRRPRPRHASEAGQAKLRLFEAIVVSLLSIPAAESGPPAGHRGRALGRRLLASPPRPSRAPAGGPARPPPAHVPQRRAPPPPSVRPDAQGLAALGRGGRDRARAAARRPGSPR